MKYSRKTPLYLCLMLSLFVMLPVLMKGEEKTVTHQVTIESSASVPNADSSDTVAYLGVTIESIPEVLRDYVDLPKGVGLLLSHISKDSPADKAGLKDNDVIVEFDGQLIITFKQLSTLIEMKGVGAKVPLKLLRKGKTVELEVVLGERKRENWGFHIPGLAPEVELEIQDELAEISDEARASVESVLESVEEWIPGSVRVVVDDDQKIHVNLEDLKENIQDLKQKLKVMNLEDKEAWKELIREYGNMGARKTIVFLDDRDVDFTNSSGKLHIEQQGETRWLKIWDANDELIYKGEYPSDPDSNPLPEKAQIILDDFLKTHDQLDLNHLEDEPVKIEMNAEITEPVTMKSS